MNVKEKRGRGKLKKKRWLDIIENDMRAVLVYSVYVYRRCGKSRKVADPKIIERKAKEKKNK